MHLCSPRLSAKTLKAMSVPGLRDMGYFPLCLFKAALARLLPPCLPPPETGGMTLHPSSLYEKALPADSMSSSFLWTLGRCLLTALTTKQRFSPVGFEPTCIKSCFSRFLRHTVLQRRRHRQAERLNCKPEPSPLRCLNATTVQTIYHFKNTAKFSCPVDRPPTLDYPETIHKNHTTQKEPQAHVSIQRTHPTI